jgi:hypothetical protein
MVTCQVMGSLEKLVRRPPDYEADVVRHSADSIPESEALEMENHRLRVAVIELESQQERLKSTISMMRAEMEQQIQKVQLVAPLLCFLSNWLPIFERLGEFRPLLWRQPSLRATEEPISHLVIFTVLMIYIVLGRRSCLATRNKRQHCRVRR